MPVTTRDLVIGPEAGKEVNLGGLGVVFKIAAEQVGGALSIVEHPMEAGRLVPPHIHRAEDEISCVVAGQFGVRIGDLEATAGPGTYVVKPRGIPHTFWNPGPGPARLIEIISPAGFERFFSELAGLAAFTPADFEQRRADLGARYDLEFVPEWIPALKHKYGLKLLGE
jgi:quercetin dioxygenase-like cupin family protein